MARVLASHVFNDDEMWDSSTFFSVPSAKLSLSPDSFIANFLATKPKEHSVIEHRITKGCCIIGSLPDWVLNPDGVLTREFECSHEKEGCELMQEKQGYKLEQDDDQVKLVLRQKSRPMKLAFPGSKFEDSFVVLSETTLASTPDETFFILDHRYAVAFTKEILGKSFVENRVLSKALKGFKDQFEFSFRKFVVGNVEPESNSQKFASFGPAPKAGLFIGTFLIMNSLLPSLIVLPVFLVVLLAGFIYTRKTSGIPVQTKKSNRVSNLVKASDSIRDRLELISQKRVFILSNVGSNMYLSVDCEKLFVKEVEVLTDAELFVIIPSGKTSFSILASNGRYVSYNGLKLTNSKPFEVDRKKIGNWEKFTFSFSNKQVTISRNLKEFFNVQKRDSSWNVNLDSIKPEMVAHHGGTQFKLMRYPS